MSWLPGILFCAAAPQVVATWRAVMDVVLAVLALISSGCGHQAVRLEFSFCARLFIVRREHETESEALQRE